MDHLDGLALPARFDSAGDRTAVAVHQREPVIALLVAVHDPVAAEAEPSAHIRRALPVCLNATLDIAAVPVVPVPVVALLAQLRLYLSIAACAGQRATVASLGADPANLDTAEGAAAVTIVHIAVITSLAVFGIHYSVAARSGQH